MVTVVKINTENGEVEQVDEELLDSSLPPTKQEMLSFITVTTQSGNTFDGNETARNNMLSAIATAEFLGETSSNWKMADNSKVTITLNELKEALALSIKKVGLIVGATE